MKRWNPSFLCAFVGANLIEQRLAFACRTGNGFLIYFSGEMARGYGAVSAVLLAGAFYLHVRRCGLGKSALLWVAATIAIYTLNPGWHYSGIRGDCGTEEAADAHQMVFYIGGLFAYQVAATAGFLWKQKSTAQDGLAQPPIARP